MLRTLASKTDQLLNRLEHVKKTGQGKWLARCPAHADRSPSLAIKEVNDRILLHCFAGCGVTEVLGAVGLTMTDLFPDRVNVSYGAVPKIPRFSRYEMFPLLMQEAIILALAWSDVITHGIMSEADKQRTQQAYQSIMRLHAEVSE
jgi:hypothetical protein